MQCIIYLETVHIISYEYALDAYKSILPWLYIRADIEDATQSLSLF